MSCRKPSRERQAVEKMRDRLQEVTLVVYGFFQIAFFVHPILYLVFAAESERIVFAEPKVVLQIAGVSPIDDMRIRKGRIKAENVLVGDVGTESDGPPATKGFFDGCRENNTRWLYCRCSRLWEDP